MRTEFAIMVDPDGPYESVHEELFPCLESDGARDRRSTTILWRGNHVNVDEQPAAGHRSLEPGDEWIGFPLQIYVCPVEKPDVSIDHQVELAEKLMKWLRSQGYRAHLLAEFEDSVDEEWLDV